MKKMLAVVLLVAVAVLSPVCSMAEMGENISIDYAPMASDFFSSYGISLGKSGSTITITFRVTAIETMSQIGVSSYDVQRKVSGTWTTVASGLPGSIGYDKASHTFSKNYSAVAGYSYRVKAKFYAKKYGGSSAISTVTSSSISV